MKPIAMNLEKTKKMLEMRGTLPEISILSLPELNKKLWGLHKKKMTIIGARTSHGKSAMALQLAWDSAKQNIPTLFLSLEMYQEDVIERLFCNVCRIDNYELLKGNFSQYLDKWVNFEQELEDKPLVITDMVGKTWQEIDDYLQMLSTKPSLIVIDHIQEAKNASLKTQKEIIDEYLKNMRVMAIKYNFSLVVCCQINRISQEEKSGEPQLHHLKNSGYVEEGADVVLLLHWPWHNTGKGDKNKYIINIAKNRNGRTGWIDVKYSPEHYLFYEEEKKEFDMSRVKWQENT